MFEKSVGMEEKSFAGMYLQMIILEIGMQLLKLSGHLFGHLIRQFFYFPHWAIKNGIQGSKPNLVVYSSCNLIFPKPRIPHGRLVQFLLCYIHSHPVPDPAGGSTFYLNLIRDRQIEIAPVW